ncbi:MAG TPA: sigma-70 family RNA polymerase sigma factor [Tepidisphaeraceae bacterium]|nr:sigma-70 family RNA polymerase sigma factor [Tepidisphaeraceae bacterium]
MSSLSGAQYEADLPPESPDAGAAASRTTDEELFRKAQAGDRGAYGQIAIRYQHRLYNAIVRMIGDREEARELTQETLVRGLSKIESFRGESQPYTWLFRIAVNLSISRLRKVQRRRTFSLNAPGRNNGRPGYDEDQAAGLVERIRSKDEPGPGEQAEQRERGEQVVAALGRLDPEYRAVLVMRDIEGFDYQQMADVLGLPLGTLKSRLFRARLALRDELKGYVK